MYNKQDMENIIQELFSDAADRGYTQEETEEMLDGINIDTLLQAIRHNAETVYAYRTDTKCEIGLNYRGEELFSQRATLLYEDIHDAVSDVAFVFRSTELWLLEDMRIAVVSCVSIVAGDDELVSEYRVFKGYDWEDCGIEDLEDFAEELQAMCARHYGYDMPIYEL